MSIKLGTRDIAGISQNKICNAHFLLEPIWSDHLINDISFLRADTFSWQDGGVYLSVYNHLVQDLQGTTAETETIGSYTVTFYRATDGHKICLADQEQTVLNIYNTYGVAWYYILDTENIRFKLPRTKWGFEGLRTNVGDKIDESLPTPSHTHTRGDMNITGYLWTRGIEDIGGRGAFYNSVSNDGWNAGHEQATRTTDINFSANRSWTGSTSQPNGLPSVYQNNAPVQERATQMYLYFYVGDYSQTAIEQTAGLNAELFNNKLDLNASNLSAQGMSYMASMGMPSNRKISLTLGASNSNYTAPADGWVNFAKKGTAQQSIILINRNNEMRVQTYQSSSNNNWNGIILPVKKNDTFTAEYTCSGDTMIFTFTYAVGSESEAQ